MDICTEFNAIYPLALTLNLLVVLKEKGNTSHVSRTNPVGTMNVWQKYLSLDRSVGLSTTHQHCHPSNYNDLLFLCKRKFLYIKQNHVKLQ